MWVYDGEQWIEEGGSEQTKKSEQQQLRIEEMFLPELQVVEIIQVPRTNRVPPFPLP